MSNIDRTRLGPFRKKHLVAAGAFLLIMLLLTLAAQNIYYYVTPKVVVSQAHSGMIEKSLQLRLTRAESDFDEAFFPLKLPASLTLYVSDLLVRPGDSVAAGEKLVQFNEKSVQDVRDAYGAALSTAQKQLDAFTGEAERLAFTHQNQMEDVNREIAALSAQTYATQSDEQQVKSLESSIRAKENALTQAREEREHIVRLVDAGVDVPNKLTQHDRSIAEQETVLLEVRADLADTKARAAASYTDAMTALTRRRSELIRDYDFNTSQAQHAGKTRAELEREVAAARADIETFNELISEDGCYRSPSDGKLERFYIERAASFAGMARVAAFAQAGTTVTYETTLAKDEALLAAGKQLTILVQGKRIPVVVESKTALGESTCVVLRADAQVLAAADISPEMAVLDAELLVNSDRYDVIVPSAAVAYVGGTQCVYVIREQNGYFGKQNYIVAVKAEPLESGGGYVAVQASGGIRDTDKIVVSWDRALQNMGKVIVVAEQ